MYLDESRFPRGGGGGEPVCRACRMPIYEGERSTRIAFANDPDGKNGFTGFYHVACSKPFGSLARAMNMISRYGR